MVAHYRKWLPSCKITVLDNYSTDTSAEVALRLGCDVLFFGSDDIMDDRIHVTLKNSVWKHLSNQWVIVIDMDEFLCVTEDELRYESEKGTALLQTKMLDMVGESQTVDLRDIDIHAIRKYVVRKERGKFICFRRDRIGEMHYWPGAENCDPHGPGGGHERPVPMSSKVYILKHLSYLGLPFLMDKMNKRYIRTELMRSNGIALHYTNNSEAIKSDYLNHLRDAALLDY
jgi:ribosome-associated toxin RatA of RatAB toxin-antitoxin module